MRRLIACLLLAIAPLSLSGCDSLPVLPVSKPSGSAASATDGSLRGFVYGTQGRGQPLRGARVEAGHVPTLTGWPADLDHIDMGPELVHESDGLVTVWRDFDDGRGLVPAERRSRVPTASNPDSHVYLRAGEFLIEGLPDGPVSVTASQCDMTSAPLGALVTAGHTTDGLALALPLEVPISNGDNAIRRVVSWRSSVPEDGFTVSVAPEGDRLSYAPSPPNLNVTLQASIGSEGTTVAGFEITYEWRAAGGETSSLKAPRLPIAPLLIPSASETCPGAPVSFQVPLGTAELLDVFLRQGAGQVVAKVRFLDEHDFEIQGMTLEALEAATNMRRL